MPDTEQNILKATGLLVIEVVNSNPNGDPDKESDPRIRPDLRGEISPVSFKRKVRDLIDDKEGPVWKAVSLQFDKQLEADNYVILESRGRVREKIRQEIKDDLFLKKYWDARVFGNTFLEEDLSQHLRTGVAQFGLGLSVAPIRVDRLTTTNKSGVQEGKDRGMAPLGYRIVQHGVYCVPFFVNPSAAQKSGCTRTDIDLLLKVIPFAYAHTAAYNRAAVEIRHAWYVEHKSPLGSVSDFAVIDALTPKKRSAPEEPSTTWTDYAVPPGLPKDLEARACSVRDLMAEAYDRAAGA